MWRYVLTLTPFLLVGLLNEARATKGQSAVLPKKDAQTAALQGMMKEFGDSEEGAKAKDEKGKFAGFPNQKAYRALADAIRSCDSDPDKCDAYYQRAVAARNQSKAMISEQGGIAASKRQAVVLKSPVNPDPQKRGWFKKNK